MRLCSYHFFPTPFDPFFKGNTFTQLWDSNETTSRDSDHPCLVFESHATLLSLLSSLEKAPPFGLLTAGARVAIPVAVINYPLMHTNGDPRQQPGRT